MNERSVRAVEILNWIWSILLIAFFTRLIYVFKAAQRYKKELEEIENERNRMREEAQKKIQPIEMVRDALSGAYIPKHQAYQAVIDGKVYFFVSWENRQLFIENVKKS